MKTINAIALSAIMVVVIFAGTQAAMAVPGHVIIYPSPPLPPKDVAVGGTITAEIHVPTPQAAAVSGVVTVHVFDAAPIGFTGFSANAATCSSQALTFAPGALGLGAGDSLSVLVDLGTPSGGPLPFEPVGAFFTGGTGADIGATLTLGPSPPVVGTVGGPVLFYLSGLEPAAAGIQTAVVGPVGWFQRIGPSAPSTTANIPNAVASTENILASCGCDDFGADGLCNAGIDANGSTQESYIVVKPVGGEIIPINTTALLIAGISSNALWMLPTLATVAGVSFVILRFQVTKKNN